MEYDTLVTNVQSRGFQETLIILSLLMVINDMSHFIKLYTHHSFQQVASLLAVSHDGGSNLDNFQLQQEMKYQSHN